MLRTDKRPWLLAAVLCVLTALTAPPARAALDPALVQALGDFNACVAAIDALAWPAATRPRRPLDALEGGRLGTVDGRLPGGDRARGAARRRRGEAIAAEAGAATRITRTTACAVRSAPGAQRSRQSSAAAGTALGRGRHPARERQPGAAAGAGARSKPKQDDAVREVLLYATAKLELASLNPAAPEGGAGARRLVRRGGQNLLAAAREARRGRGGDLGRGGRRGTRAAAASMRAIDRRIGLAQTAGTLFSGLSLGSILLLVAALGLAITYGVMGVINMAHGELLMVGAYATFVVQGVFRSHFPEYLDLYVLAAIPAASSPPRWSASSWSAWCCATSTAARWRTCSPPGACRWC